MVDTLARRSPPRRWITIGLLLVVNALWGMMYFSYKWVGLASISIYLLPFFGVLFSALVLGERIEWPMTIGGGITLAGAVYGVSSGTAEGGGDPRERSSDG